MLETILDYMQIPVFILSIFFFFFFAAAGVAKFAEWLAFRKYNVQPKAKSLLKPCPHCGGEASVDFDECSEQYVVYCHNPSCSWQDTKEDAVKAWNTRVKE